MVNVRIGDHSLEIAENLNELSRSQLLRLLKGVYFRSKSGYNGLDVSRVSLLKILLDQGELFYTFLKNDAARECILNCTNNCKTHCQYDELWMLELRDLIKLTDPFFEKLDIPETIQPIYSLRQTLSRQLIPHFWHWGIRYSGCDDALENLTFDRWITADLFYMHYIRTNDMEYLDKLISQLYEPGLYRFIRVLFPSFESIPFLNMGKIMGGISPELKLAIFLFYVSSRAFLAAHFSKVFDMPDEAALKKNEEDVIRSQWYDAKFNIAEKQIFGNFDNVGKTKIAYILKHINMLIIRNEKQRQQQEITAARSLKR